MIRNQVTWALALAGLAAFAEPYLETTGAQAVNTGYYPNPKTKIVVDWAYTAVTPVQQRIFGTYDSANRNLFYCSSYINGGGGYSWTLQNYSGNWTAFAGGKANTARRTLTLDGPGNRASITDNGTNIVQTITQTRTNRANTPLVLFAQPNDLLATPGKLRNFGKLRFYSMQVYEDGTLLHDYRPRTCGGEGVVYDTVDQTAYRSITATPVTASEECETFDGTALSDPSSASGLCSPEIPAEGLTVENVTYAGPFIPRGDTVNAQSGAVTLRGNNTFGGFLSLWYAPRTVSPREYVKGGFSKNYAGETDANVQVTYAITGDPNGRTTFAGGFEDFTDGQRGDVVMLEGNFTFGGNVTPNGNDGGLVFKAGDYDIGSIAMINRGHNSQVYVESGATTRVRGSVYESAIGAGNPFHLHIDGTLSVDGTLSPYGNTSRLDGTGVVNAHAFRASAMGAAISVSRFNVGTGGAQCGATRFGAIEIGCYDGRTAFSGSYTLASGATFRAEQTDGTAADICLQGAPTAAALTKTGAGALIIDTTTPEGLTGAINVTAGALVFNTPARLTCPVTVAAGASLGATATGAGELTNVTLADGAALTIEASPTGMGSVRLPAGAVTSALTVTVDGANPPPTGTAATILSGANLSADDLAHISLNVTGGQMEGALSVSDGDLVLTVTESTTAAAETLTWSAADSTTWDTTTANWLDAQETAQVFGAYDNVRFGDIDGAVTVVADGVAAGSVTFDGAGRSYTVTGGQIGGTGELVIDGGATVALGAKLDAQPIIIRNGVLKPTAADAALLGSPNVPITVLDGGTFDVNKQSKNATELLRTHNKAFRIAGEGATNELGVKMGAIANTGTYADIEGRLHTIELTDDAMIRIQSGRLDLRQRNDGAKTTRPRITGPDHVLTLAGGNLCVINGDVDLRQIVITNNANFSFESDAKEKFADGVLIRNGILQFWNHSTAFTNVIVADGMSPRILGGAGTATLAAPITVTEGTTLNFEGANWAATKVAGGITGPGSIKVGGAVQYFTSDLSQTNLLVTGGFAVYGDGTAAGNAKKWPKTITLNGDVNSTHFALQPSTNSVCAGYTLGGTGNFVPSRRIVGSKIVTTVEDTVLQGENMGIAMGFGTNNSPNMARMDGCAVLGQGFRADNLARLWLGFFPNSADAQLTIETGASVTMKSGAQTTLGLWSGDTNNVHRVIVDGGTFDASAANAPCVGYDGRVAEFLVRSGTAKLRGVSTRAHKQHNMTPIPVNVVGHAGSGIGYEVFGMSGGTVELSGSFTTQRAYPYLPQIWLGGGVLKSLTDWNTSPYQYATFEIWGDPRENAKETFTLDTNGRTVTFRSPLQGNANVKITGSGDFVADYDMQGGVSGHWTVENTGTANLRNAAAFADGLTLKDGTTATIDIGARTDYVGLSVAYNGTNDVQGNEFTYDNFYVKAGVFPSVFTKDIQKILLKPSTPTYTAYRMDAEFYVAESDTYTFGVTYDDRGDITIDGTRVAYNASWNSIGTGQIALDAGWHSINVTCKDNAGGAGPATSGEPGNWRKKNMAVGWHKGATTSQSAADYQPISPATLTMRPVSTVRWNHRYTDAAVPADWASNDSYEFTQVTNSMQGIHNTGWLMNKGALNSYSGWMYVESEEAGTWALDGVYDDRIGLQIDGKTVFENATWNVAKTGSATVEPGWHSFKVTVADGSGGWSWSGVTGYGAALYVKRPCDATKVTFDERNLRMSANPYGFIGGELSVGAGATLSNASTTACEIIGTVNGTGTLTGKYALSGTWNLTMDDGRTLKSVTWRDGVDLSNGTLNIALTNKKPVSAKYDLGAVSGLDGLTQAQIDAKINVTLDGEEDLGRFSLVVQDGQATLKNLKPSSTVFYLR